MSREPVSRAVLLAHIRSLGVRPGGVLLVHTAFSRTGPVEGGPLGLIEALRDAMGPWGTVVMPSMSDDDDDVFDPKASACVGLGVVADTFWRLPEVLRSNSPHAFAAVGPEAARITADHPLEPPHGLDSPVGRVYELDGQVLLVGVGHDADTTIHLAEALAGVRYRRAKYATVLVNGQPVRRDYEETDHCCERFNILDEWLGAVDRQNRGIVGHGQARLADSREIVDLAVARLRENETIFLHQPGRDVECDEARASLGRR
jgi:aminoglycoside 3-N-acetyltransferase